MRINEIVVDFPNQLLTKQGTVRKSDVIGKTPDGHLVHRDEFTGLPIVINKKERAYYVDPDTYELPNDYDENYEDPKEWLIVDRADKKAHGIYTNYETARTELRRLRRWHRKNFDIIAI